MGSRRPRSVGFFSVSACRATHPGPEAAELEVQGAILRAAQLEQVVALGHGAHDRDEKQRGLSRQPGQPAQELDTRLVRPLHVPGGGLRVRPVSSSSSRASPISPRARPVTPVSPMLAPPECRDGTCGWRKG
jgi:hypothetical protein